MTNIYMEMPKYDGHVVGVYAAGENIPVDLANQEWRNYLVFLESGGKPLPFDPTLEWKNGGWVQNADKVSAFLDAFKAKANARIDSITKSKRAQIAGTDDDAEIAGWTNKLRIAQEIDKGLASEADKDVFHTEIAARGIAGETLDIFVQKVIKNAVFFALAAAVIDGLKRKAQDAVAASQSPAETVVAVDNMVAQIDAEIAKTIQRLASS